MTDQPEIMAAIHRVAGAVLTINPLSNPKGVKRLCELCEKPAHLQCASCHVTFYCDIEHQQADWVGIHQRVCELLFLIRSPAPSLSLQADRDNQSVQMKLRQVELIEISRDVAQNKLLEGKHQESLPAALLSLRCAKDVHGPTAVQMLPAYQLLAHANIGLGSLDQAEKYLSHAEWIVMRTPDCGQAVRQDLHRILGRLYTAKGDLEAALFHLATDVYYASEVYGLNSTVTCGGYFLLANVFVKQGKMPIAHSLYSEVASTWHSYLTELVEKLTQKTPNTTVSMEPCLDRAKLTEADQVLRAMLEMGEDGAPTAMVAHCLAMLWFLARDTRKAVEFGNRAWKASQLVTGHSLSEPIQSLLQLLQRGPHPATDAS